MVTASLDKPGHNTDGTGAQQTTTGPLNILDLQRLRPTSLIDKPVLPVPRLRAYRLCGPCGKFIHIRALVLD
jgi:hypothetical protein